MADVPQLPLKEFFKLFAPTYVLGTTYTASLAFFEGVVFPEIKRAQLRRCLILCDKVGFQRATVEASALRSVGRDYMAVCPPIRHAFHPKVWLLLGEGKAAVLVGSGNLTQSGFMDNAEIFEVMQFSEDGPHRAVVEDLVRFVAGLRSMWTGPDSRRLLAVEVLEEMRRELNALAVRMPDDPSPEVRFLSNFERPLVDQLGDVFLGGTLRVAAPYFGGSTAGVKLLQDKMLPDELRVFPAIHGGSALDIDLTDLKAMSGVSVKSLKLSQTEKGAFAHLKLYGFDGERGQWLFTTSANCTVAALGGDNVEAGLLRRVDREILDEYFAEHVGEELPSARRIDDFPSGDGWLSFWASDRGEAVEFIVHDKSRTPLQDVTITIKAGGISESHSYPRFFAGGAIDRLPWSDFRSLTDRVSHPALVSLEAVDALGKQVHGDAIIDNPLLLSSDPVHRSAWRAALALLESEGLPESADLASVFHLVQEVFNADEEEIGEAGPTTRAAKVSSRSSIPDKVPVWPPLAHQDWTGSFSGNSSLQNLEWFQKILSEFLNPKLGENSGAGSANAADGMDQEVTALAKQKQIPASVVKSIWKQASESFQQLRKRLLRLVVTANSSKKIWPVSTALFLVTLVTRRRILEQSNQTQGIESVADLVRAFLQLLFVDRAQPADYQPSLQCRYPHETFPSIAEDLYETFDQRPSGDIAGIICLMFAYWHASEKAMRRSPVLAWLQFREIAPNVASGGDLDKKSLRIAFDRYLFDDAAGIRWSDIESAFDELIGTDWNDHPGFRELIAIVAKAEGRSDGEGLPLHLEERWPQALRRIRSGKPWRFAVDPFSETCAAEDCSGQNVSDPRKRQNLSRYAPTICGICGAVLVPEPVLRAYEEAHERHS